MPDFASWHLIIQELEQTGQSALDVLKEQSLFVKDAITLILLLNNEEMVNNFVSFL